MKLLTQMQPAGLLNLRIKLECIANYCSNYGGGGGAEFSSSVRMFSIQCLLLSKSESSDCMIIEIAMD